MTTDKNWNWRLELELGTQHFIVEIVFRGCPATVENKRRKLLTNSHQVAGETFSRSRMAGASDGVEPRLPDTVCRAVQSSNSK